MARDFDIVAIGECLIDFTPALKKTGQYPSFTQNPGGAPANMIASAAKLGAHTAFLGKVGRDQFGCFLRQVLLDAGACVDGLVLTEDHKTTLAFVTLDTEGQREFIFYREPGADQMLTEAEIDYDILRRTRVLHISSLAYCGEEISKAADAAAAFAKDNGAWITYDANWRPMLWKDIQEGKRRLADGLRFADIVKASDDELTYLTGEPDEAIAAAKLLDGGIKLLVVTKGSRGSTIYAESYHVDVPAYPVQAVDTTGAGDAFFGSFVAQLLRFDSFERISSAQMRECAEFSSAFAAISTTRLGGIPSLPELAEAEAFVRAYTVEGRV